MIRYETIIISNAKTYRNLAACIKAQPIVSNQSVFFVFFFFCVFFLWGGRGELKQWGFDFKILVIFRKSHVWHLVMSDFQWNAMWAIGNGVF